MLILLYKKKKEEERRREEEKNNNFDIFYKIHLNFFEHRENYAIFLLETLYGLRKSMLKLINFSSHILYFISRGPASI